MSKISIGIVGLPNVGKSTLFKILTKIEVNIANYPFATINPNVGVVPVPDERLEKLAKLSRSKRIVPAVVEFYDIAGLVKGAYKGEGLGNQFLSHIREVNAILHLVRTFKSGEITHVEGAPDPLRDIDIIETELTLKDLETVEKRLVRTEADARSGKKEFIEVRDDLLELKKHLEAGGLARGRKTADLQLLTSKPQLFLLNGAAEDVDDAVIKKIKELGSDYIIADLSSAKELPELTQKAYQTLNLISFFTTGEDETRAWTIEKGTRVRQAAGVIHTDFENKFIRAEVIGWQKLLEAGGPSVLRHGLGQSPWAIAKQKGWLRVEGKDYVVQDGDVIVVRHG